MHYWREYAIGIVTTNGEDLPNIKKELPYDPAILFLGIYPKE